MEKTVALKIRSRLGEGIWWDDRRACLFWVDIMKKEVHCLKDGQDKLLKVFDDFVGFCAPCEDGRLVVGCGRNLPQPNDSVSIGESADLNLNALFIMNDFNRSICF